MIGGRVAVAQPEEAGPINYHRVLREDEMARPISVRRKGE